MHKARAALKGPHLDGEAANEAKRALTARRKNLDGKNADAAPALEAVDDLATSNGTLTSSSSSNTYASSNRSTNSVLFNSGHRARRPVPTPACHIWSGVGIISEVTTVKVGVRPATGALWPPRVLHRVLRVALTTVVAATISCGRELATTSDLACPAVLAATSGFITTSDAAYISAALPNVRVAKPAGEPRSRPTKLSFYMQPVVDKFTADLLRPYE